VRLGAHLPLADLGDGRLTGADLRGYARTARELGYVTLSANDHLRWGHPWLDGPTALAAVLSEADGMTLATSITLPVVRHPVVVAKTLTTLAVLADGPVVGGLGPGSSRADYAAVGVPFDERWARFDEALPLVRALVRGEPAEPGKYYAAHPDLAPRPEVPPQVWFGSWGSDRRLASMAGVADGWLASAYNATPEQYADARARLDDHLRAASRDPAAFPDSIATMWAYVTDQRSEADELRTRVLGPALKRDPELLADLPVGSRAHCVEVLARYAEAGAGEVLVWPVRDAVHQLELVADAARDLH
jgi:alkanesulfonate monooxygenase SsuD/methylene tetrahydromethanopterin reductase-like flavin-dependent oxidoreductase (luciferase family)